MHLTEASKELGSGAQVRPSGAERRGFTIVELLVVVAVVAILVGLLSPALAKAKAQAQGLRCRANLHQLQFAALLYAGDNEDRVVPNWSFLRRSWVFCGDYARDLPDLPGTTNLQWLIAPGYAAFSDYIECPGLYRCPADSTTVLISRRPHRWVRSYGAVFHQRKMADFGRIPSLGGQPVPPVLHRTFDEPHPGYLIGLDGIFGSYQDFLAFPAYRHNGAGAFSFADGHVELHRWVDARTRRKPIESLRYDSSGTARWSSCPQNPDLRWLADRVGVAEEPSLVDPEAVRNFEREL
jgi:prepilin-type N-terminal cleavage/methylation domain-containing protein/prepilin-type processing-associated H-X9-DG protein